MSNKEIAVVHSSHGSAMMLDKATFEQAYRAAKLFAASKLVPTHFQGKEADCFIGLMVANRMGEDPLTVLQNMFVVHGRPGWATQYMISRANKSGIFKGRITWDETGNGDALSITAKATLADTGQEIKATVDMKMAKAEAWTKNPKYQSMPGLMLKYRSAAMLIRLYCPEVMLGYQTVEELETLPMKDVTPKENSVTANINEMIRSAENAAAAEIGDEQTQETQEGDVIEEAEKAVEQALQDQEKASDDDPLLTLEALGALPEKTLRDIEIKAREAIRLIVAGEDREGVMQSVNSVQLLKRLRDGGRGPLADKLLAA